MIIDFRWFLERYWITIIAGTCCYAPGANTYLYVIIPLNNRYYHTELAHKYQTSCNNVVVTNYVTLSCRYTRDTLIPTIYENTIIRLSQNRKRQQYAGLHDIKQ